MSKNRRGTPEYYVKNPEVYFRSIDNYLGLAIITPSTSQRNYMQITTSVIDKPVTVVQKQLVLQIEVDTDFIAMINGLGYVSTSSLEEAGMTNEQAGAYYKIYVALSKALDDSGLYYQDCEGYYHKEQFPI